MKTNNRHRKKRKIKKRRKIFITPSRDLFRFSLHFIKRLISLFSHSHKTESLRQRENRSRSQSISYILALTFLFCFVQVNQRSVKTFICTGELEFSSEKSYIRSVHSGMLCISNMNSKQGINHAKLLFVVWGYFSHRFWTF